MTNLPAELDFFFAVVITVLSVKVVQDMSGGRRRMLMVHMLDQNPITVVTVISMTSQS